MKKRAFLKLFIASMAALNIPIFAFSNNNLQKFKIKKEKKLFWLLSTKD
jgi:hypothetical protein|tara:strand:+ start:182 stop:328 length:147 start_codon:yes stop_codon:yes gene_type:complete